MMKILFTLGMALLLSACAVLRSAHVQTPKVEVVKGQWMQLPTPEQFAVNKQAGQILTAHYGDKSYTSEVRVESSNQQITLVALGGWGGELFSIQYDGANIKSQSLPIPHLATGIDHTLTDFIFTYGSKNLIEQLLKPTQIKFHQTQHQRIFTLDGVTMMTIDYQYTDPWQGKVVLKNLSWHYEITLENLPSKSVQNRN